MSTLSSHLISSVKAYDPSTEASDPSTSYSTGICSSISHNSVFSPKQCWIIDSGASRHICSQANFFKFLELVTCSIVTLPNNAKILVCLSGDVQRTSNLLLKNVLFVPQFHFNLLSVSAFVANSNLSVSFFLDYFLI